MYTFFVRLTFETAFFMSCAAKSRKTKRSEEPLSLSPKDTCALGALLLPDLDIESTSVPCLPSSVLVFGSADPQSTCRAQMVPGSYRLIRKEDGGFHWLHSALDVACAAWRHGDSFVDVRAHI